MTATQSTKATDSPKASKEPRTKPATEAQPAPPALPAGYEVTNGDLVGYWDESAPIHVVPLGLVVQDGNIDATKPSVLIRCRLVDPAPIRFREGPESEWETIVGKPGDMVGIWGRAGLVDLSKRADTPCFIVPDGEKKIKGRPQPMKLFQVLCPKGAKKRRLMVDDDRRDKSRAVPCPWLPGAGNGAVLSDDDNIPF